ncbi:lamin tail domain-containing protein [Anaerolinea thermophila]|uniref:lamin tail domain-containing protein n=1 Tax=Anaerolinea thermophila TaxID=167964 RepID=UPI0026ED1B69|nr:lamin tail domain-containing protein [Anaerolinea thermophila]
MRRPRTSLWLYLLLNVLVSAATMLAVLYAWERTHGRAQSILPVFPTPVAAQATVTPTAPPPPVEAAPSPTPYTGEPLVQIVAVIGATDPQQEYVVLKRVGEGDLNMDGWVLRDEDGNELRFPPGLTLFPNGGLLIYTRTGTDTVSELYWNRSEAVWRPGEVVTLVDPAGQVHATYTVP